jgi:hypothetical protein
LARVLRDFDVDDETSAVEVVDLDPQGRLDREEDPTVDHRRERL